MSILDLGDFSILNCQTPEVPGCVSSSNSKKYPAPTNSPCTFHEGLDDLDVGFFWKISCHTWRDATLTPIILKWETKTFPTKLGDQPTHLPVGLQPVYWGKMIISTKGCYQRLGSFPFNHARHHPVMSWSSTHLARIKCPLFSHPKDCGFISGRCLFYKFDIPSGKPNLILSQATVFECMKCFINIFRIKTTQKKTALQKQWWSNPCPMPVKKSCAAARINTLKSGSVSPMIHVTVLYRCIHANPQKPVAAYIYIYIDIL